MARIDFDAAREVRADREKVAWAIEEALRWESPLQRCVHLWPFASPLSCVELLSAPSDADPCASSRRVEQVAPIFVFSIHELIPKRWFWD